MKHLFLLCIHLSTVFFAVSGQENWKLHSDRDQTQTYSKEVPGSKIRAVKIHSDMNGDLTALTRLILDVSRYDQWVYNSRSTRLLKQVSPGELYYYSEVIFPWPTQNRDFVSHMQLQSSPDAKTVTISANNVPGWVPPSPRLVRIDHSTGTWTLAALPGNRVSVTYELQVDPGGSLPAWIINTFSFKGLVLTFQNLRKELTNTVSSAASPSSF